MSETLTILWTSAIISGVYVIAKDLARDRPKTRFLPTPDKDPDMRTNYNKGPKEDPADEIEYEGSDPMTAPTDIEPSEVEDPDN